MAKTFTLREIAEHVGGDVQGDDGREIAGVGSLRNATEKEITYLDSDRHLKDLPDSRAAAIIVGRQIEVPDAFHLVRVDQPGVAWARTVALLRPHVRQFTGISEQAHIGRDVEIGADVGIAPGAFVGDRVRIGRGTEIYPGVTIGADSSIGEECRFHAGVHIYHQSILGSRVILHSGVVIGADGYGFAQERRDDPSEPLRHEKVPQVGRVVIEDDVEIGANSTIDRGALDDTVIGRGTKIDNLVMVAHNCRVGKHCLLVGQSGLSGSIELGDYVTIAGQAGLTGHIKVGTGATVAAKSGVMKDIPDGQVMAGSPALPGNLAFRAYAQIENLPQFRKQITALEKRVSRLETDS